MVDQPTKKLYSGLLVDHRVLNSHNVAKLRSSSGVETNSQSTERTSKATPAVNFIKRHTQVPRNISISTIATTVTVDSNISIDSSTVSSNATVGSTPLRPGPFYCQEAPRYYSVVNDEESLLEFLSVLDRSENYFPDLFVDCEGENGLGGKLFDTPARTGKKRTLLQIFEDQKIPVIIFDVRADSNAMHGHFKVHLGGVIDLSVMEMVARGSCPTYRHGLDRCIQELPDEYLSPEARETWVNRKNAGKRICSGPEGYGAFNQRPLPRALEEYAINDVENMPELFNYLSEGMGLCKDPEKMRLTLDVSKEMVALSISPGFKSHNNPSNKYGPKTLTDCWPYDPYDDDDFYFY